MFQEEFLSNLQLRLLALYYKVSVVSKYQASQKNTNLNWHFSCNNIVTDLLKTLNYKDMI
jgi:hypothetical protein